jgi:hypothetical protein
MENYLEILIPIGCTLLAIIALVVISKKRISYLIEHLSVIRENQKRLSTLLSNFRTTNYKSDKETIHEIKLLEKDIEQIDKNLTKFANDFDRCTCDMKANMEKLAGVIMGMNLKIMEDPIQIEAKENQTFQKIGKNTLLVKGEHKKVK